GLIFVDLINLRANGVGQRQRITLRRDHEIVRHGRNRIRDKRLGRNLAVGDIVHRVAYHADNLKRVFSNTEWRSAKPRNTKDAADGVSVAAIARDEGSIDHRDMRTIRSFVLREETAGY